MMNKKVIIIISVVLVSIILIAAVAANKRGAKPETVKTTTVTQGDLKSYLSTNANIQSKNFKAYMGAAQLTVKSINVKVGDSVKKGRVMLAYDLSDLNTSVSQARLQYDNAVLQKNELLNQRDQLNGTINKMDSQIKKLEASQNPSDKVQLQTLKQQRESLQPISDEKIKLMDNSVALAKLGLDSAQARLDKYKSGITADFDGVVTALDAVEGAALSPAQPAVVVQDLDNLKAVLSLGKYDAQKVSVGQEAILKSGEKKYSGTVSFISPAAEKTTSLAGQDTNLEAEVDILDKTPELKVDFDTNVDILLGSVNNILKLPVECIQYDKTGRSFVYIIVEGKAKQVEIQLGLQSDMEAEVLKGLSKGDTVILNPGISIKDGTSVKVVESENK